VFSAEDIQTGKTHSDSSAYRQTRVKQLLSAASWPCERITIFSSIVGNRVAHLDGALFSYRSDMVYSSTIMVRNGGGRVRAILFRILPFVLPFL
jgi:hypothetical protein